MSLGIFSVGLTGAVLAATAAAPQAAQSEAKPGVNTVADAINALEDKAAEPRLLNPGEVMRGSDYPQDALDKGEQGTAQIRLTINPDGRVTACSIVKSSDSALLDGTSCRLYSERARYEPGTADGKPRVVQTEVRWRMFPQTGGRSRLGWFQRITGLVKADGRMLSCKMESSEGPDVDCWTPQPLRPETAANYVKAVGDPAKLITYMRFSPEGETPEPPRMHAAFPMRSAKLVVKSDGSLRSCEVLEAGTSPRESVCREAGQYKFEKIADGPDATGIVRMWSYLEPGSKP